MKTTLFFLIYFMLGGYSFAQHAPSDAHNKVMFDAVGMPAKAIRTVGILVYPGCNDLDFMGPRYVLGQYMGAKTMLIGTRPGTIRTVMGVSILTDTLMDQVAQLDVLVVPGGAQGTIDVANDKRVLAWLQKIDPQTQITSSVCTGAWVLGAAGVLNGKSVSTNWYRAAETMLQFGATYTGKRYTQDGKYWTAAGVTAGLDMSLALLRHLWSEPYAQAVMLDMEYDPAPPFEGGSPKRSPKPVFELMQAMYDMGMREQVRQLKR
jgi:transcriptional regulator GlxA family with amidase domain